MPIYEYECGTCNKRTELLQKISDPPLEKCPDCNGEVSKLISSAGIHFKGTGWYVTDYAKKKGESSESSESSKKDKKADTTPSKTKEGSKSKKEGAASKSTTASKD